MSTEFKKLDEHAADLKTVLIGQHAPKEADDCHSDDNVDSDTRAEIMEEFRADFLGAICAPDTRFLVGEMFDWFEERGLFSGQAKNHSSAHHRIGMVKVLEFLYENHKSIKNFALLKALNDPLLEDVLRHRSMAEFARLIDKDGQGAVSREAVRKEVEKVQTHFKLPKLPEQRDEIARDKMSATAIARLTNAAKKNGHSTTKNTKRTK